MTEETATRKSGKERQSEISEFGWCSSWKKQNHIFVPFLKICFDEGLSSGVMHSKNRAKNELLLQTKNDSDSEPEALFSH
jgi:hypothetical protein